MRALTQEEFDVLRNIETDEDLDDEPYLKLCSVLETLSHRRLVVVSFREHNGHDGADVDITPLGRLALRVSRPEMAFTI